MCKRKSQRRIKENQFFIFKECQRQRNHFTETSIFEDRNYEYNDIERIKRKNKIIKKIIQFIIYRKIIKLLIIINLFYLSLPNNNHLLIKNNFSNGSGFKGIYSNSQYFFQNFQPDEVYINGNKEYASSYSYLNQENNLVKLVWYIPINDSMRMFDGCSDIIEINLTNFDSSLITRTSYMFKDCSSLTSIDFTNFNISKLLQCLIFLMDVHH